MVQVLVLVQVLVDLRGQGVDGAGTSTSAGTEDLATVQNCSYTTTKY